MGEFFAHLNTTQWHRVAVLLCLACLGIGMGVGFTIATNNAKADADADYANRFAIFSDWQIKLSSRFSQGQSLAATIASFAMNSVDTPTNMSLPAAEKRTEVGEPGAYARLCRGLARDVPGITSMSLAPGGVLSQSYSYRDVKLGFDLYPTNKHTWDRMMVDGLPATTGPNKLASRPGIAVNMWYPIFSNDTVSPESFWGAAVIVIEIADLLSAMNIDALYEDEGMHYVMWYTESNGEVKVVATSEGAPNATVMGEGLRMTLPVGEEGKTSYFAMYPRAGVVENKLPTGAVVGIIMGTLSGTMALLCLWYGSLLCYFMYRHRNAPSTLQKVYIAAITLRGAQPIADRAPLEAVRIFADFISRVRLLAVVEGCYPVSEIGDRCVYVASSCPERLLALARHSAAEVRIMVGRPTAASRPGTAVSLSQHSAHRSRSTSRAGQPTMAPTGTPRHHDTVTSHISESSFMATVACHASAACHAATVSRAYDASRDVYFYGSAATLSKLCGALDQTRSGEVGWTEAFQTQAGEACGALCASALSTNEITADETVVHVASWWNETGDERDNEDPSTAMAILSDAYVRRMTVIVSNGRQGGLGGGASKGKGSSGGSKEGRSDKSAEATSVTRNATLLQISLTTLPGDLRASLDVVRKIVSEERGAVVSAHETTVVAAFNLLSPCGQHQVRAAHAVHRLRASLHVPFVCSIHGGKVSALIADGLVMCTGDAVGVGRGLLQRAIALSDATATSKPAPLLPALPSPVNNAYATMTKRSGSLTTFVDPAGAPSSYQGLCLLLCYDELSANYDCEGVGVIRGLEGGKGRILYRLAELRASKASADEWMYQLKDDEDASEYAAVNAVLARLLEGDTNEAVRLWEQIRKNSHVSDVARTSIASQLVPLSAVEV